MTYTISKLFPTGNLQSGVELDEVTYNSIKFSNSGIYASAFDEVTHNGDNFAERRTSAGELIISGEFDEQTISNGLALTGQLLVSTSGVSSWTVPEGVISISAVTIGGGGGGGRNSGGGGGGLGWKNNIAVTPGETLTITVGTSGAGALATGATGGTGGVTSISRGATILLSVNGGTGGRDGVSGVGGTVGITASGGGRGGHGGQTDALVEAGGGGAGGWTGFGGFGAAHAEVRAVIGDDGAGGGGGGGGRVFPGGAGRGGGGTNPQGMGTGGRRGSIEIISPSDPTTVGKGGSAFGSTAFDASVNNSNGGFPGGGGGSRGSGSNGAVNIIWGLGVSFPRGLPPVFTTTYQIYDTQGVYYWRAPAGVTSVNVACVGGGGGGGRSGSKDGGGGGGLGWKNNIAVTPGQDYLVVVGAAGHTYIVDSGFFSGRNGGDSYFIDSTTVKGGGTFVRFGGSWAGDGGYSGGSGGIGINGSNGNAGGGSAATFSGAGAAGINQTGDTDPGPGTPVSLRGISDSANFYPRSAGRFGAGSPGPTTTSSDYDGAGGSGGVWIDWTPASSFPSIGI